MSVRIDARFNASFLERYERVGPPCLAFTSDVDVPSRDDIAVPGDSTRQIGIGLPCSIRIQLSDQEVRADASIGERNGIIR